MSEVDKAIRRRAAKSPGFATSMEKELAELRIGLAIKELRQKHGVTAILIRHPDGSIAFSPGAGEAVGEGDMLVLAGSVDDLDRLERRE